MQWEDGLLLIVLIAAFLAGGFAYAIWPQRARQWRGHRHNWFFYVLDKISPQSSLIIIRLSGIAMIFFALLLLSRLFR